MSRSYEWYIDRGYEPAVAKYLSEGRKTATDVKANPDYTLIIEYDHTEHRLFDMKPLIRPKTVFEFLSDIDAFMRVYIDDTHNICWDKDPKIDSNVVWSNKVDISADNCYIKSTSVD